MVETLKTKNYEMFKFTDLNRAQIYPAHVNLLMGCIEQKNLLETRPILVNEKMEVLDGQHRLLAASKLGIEIYYRVEKSLNTEDLLLLNISKSWRRCDYLNFFVKSGYPEYVKLKNFIFDMGLSLEIGMTLAEYSSHSKGVDMFKRGMLKFNPEESIDDLHKCKEIIEHLEIHLGKTKFLRSLKFWKSLVHVVTSDWFNEGLFKKNIVRLSSRLAPRVNKNDYITMLKEIHDYNSRVKKIE